MKKLSFMHLLFWCMFAFPALLFAQNNDCPESSMHCWKKTWLEPSVLQCSEVVTFTDEFTNGNYTNTHWDYDYGSGAYETAHHPCEEQLYNNSPLTSANGFNNGNVRIDPANGGRCVLTGKHEVPNIEYTWPGDANSQPIHFSREFSSGMLYGKRSFHYGRIETRILDMPGDGWWPAFWVWDYEEIDVMERFAGGSSYYYNSYPGNQICPGGNEATTAPNALFGGPHTFAMEWTPFKTIYFYNGQQLPKVIYKYYNLDGTPLDVDCGDAIPGGFYYVNPNFISPWREEGSGTIATSFKPIINLAVLTRYGLRCCTDYSSGTGEIQYCADGVSPNCTPLDDSECSDWGNPFDKNGNFRGGNFESTTEMSIDYFKLNRNAYHVPNSLALTYDNEICAGSEFELIIESIGNSAGLLWDDNVVNIQSITTTSNLISTGVTTPHKRYFNVGMVPGPARFTINYTNSSGAHSITKEVTIVDCSNGVDPCADESAGEPNAECCPVNTFYDTENCFYGNIPEGYTGYITNNTFYVNPNASGGCPPGYNAEVVNVGGTNRTLCNSGINIPQVHPGSTSDPDHYQGFILGNGFYVQKECEDLRDCCPINYDFDGSNCFSGVTYSSEWQPFIYGGSFYVVPHYDQNNNPVCPDPANNPNDPYSPNGWAFDGANCHSGVYFNEPYVPFIENGGFYVEPYCEDVNDCCPLGTIVNEPGGNCLFGYGPAGYAYGQVIGNRYCFRAPANCGQATECCPDGYSELIYEGIKYCYDPNIEIPAGFGGFIWGETPPLSLYVVKNCPQERCCPENANYVISNVGSSTVAGKCWYANIPQNWMELAAPEDNRIVIYLVNQEECLNQGFQWNAQNNTCYIEVPTNLANSLEIIGSSVYTNVLPGCETHAVAPQDTRSENEIDSSNKGDDHANAQPSISIFPNPASNLLNVRFDEEFSGPTVMKIFDSKGQLVESTTIIAPAKGSILTLFLQDLLPGNYFLNLSSNTNHETHYFIKM